MTYLPDFGVVSNPVKDWEAWNEPNGSAAFNGGLPDQCNGSGPDGYPDSNPCGQNVNGTGYLCGQEYVPVRSTVQECGPYEAFNLWELAQSDAQSFTGMTNGYTVAALTLSAADNSTYETAYISEALCQVALGWNNAFCGGTYYTNSSLAVPSTWAVHDYEDPSSGMANARLWTPLRSKRGLGIRVAERAYSEPPLSFCVLTRIPSSGCSRFSLDAEDWSTNPGGAGN